MPDTVYVKITADTRKWDTAMRDLHHYFAAQAPLLRRALRHAMRHHAVEEPMSHHHTPAAPAMTCAEFFATFLGEDVALIRSRQPKIIGRLVHVGDTGDDHDPLLVVELPGDLRERARFSDLTRAKLHTTPTPKDRR